MTSSFTGGINAPFNVLLQRGLNLLDVTDPVAARQNIGAVGSADIKTLTFGSGLISGAYDTTTATTLAVDTDSSGAAGKVVKTDANGDLTTTQKLNFGTSGSYIQRVTGTNGAMVVNNTGNGTLQINNNAGAIQLVTAASTSSTTKNGTVIALTNDAAAPHTALIVDGSGGNTGSLGLSVTSGATIDTLSVTGALNATGGLSGTTATFSGALSGTTATFSGALSATSGSFTSLTGTPDFPDSLTVAGSKVPYSISGTMAGTSGILSIDVKPYVTLYRSMVLEICGFHNAQSGGGYVGAGYNLKLLNGNELNMFTSVEQCFRTDYKSTGVTTSTSTTGGVPNMAAYGPFKIKIDISSTGSPGTQMTVSSSVAYSEQSVGPARAELCGRMNAFNNGTYQKIIVTFDNGVLDGRWRLTFL